MSLPKPPDDLLHFYEGYEAFKAGTVVGDNPHNESSGAYWQWMRGWASAGLNKQITNNE